MNGHKKCSPGCGTLRRAGDNSRAAMLSTLDYTTFGHSVNAQDPHQHAASCTPRAAQRDLQALIAHAQRRAAYHQGLAAKHAAIAAALAEVLR